MPRAIDDIFSRAISQRDIGRIMFVRIDFDAAIGGINRLCSNSAQVRWRSHAWFGAGDLMSLSPVRETLGLEAVDYRIEFSWARNDNFDFGTLERRHFLGKTIKAWFAPFQYNYKLPVDRALATDPRLLGEPYLFLEGKLDRDSFSETATTGNFSFDITNELAILRQAPNLRYSSEHQNFLYPKPEDERDTGLDNISRVASATIRWPVTY